ncbi:hypothetical protein GBA65_16270 [Rubrobacter marinus]|uniref:Uncharacterized protein n=1 Tax=Rubrobacter marinus TaxID=2653852 RepID=A0A6G8Q0H2_9ACTN|nr:hypothetical protein [Rubrobacter marinus]QIN79827.1 hypothetical protein GBA65_16270 [Rubrobacter marinus]
MPKAESYFELWPVRVPRSLPLPETSVFDNLAVSALLVAPPKGGSGKILWRRLQEEERKTAGTR